MDASCGPSNAISQLSKHTQRDTSLQHEHPVFAGNNRQNAFRNGPGLDANLNQEFQNFSHGSFSDFQSPILNSVHVHGSQNFGQEQHTGNQSLRSGNSGRSQEWVSDFSGLSIHEKQALAQQNSVAHLQPMSHNVNQQLHQGQKSDWHKQFMENLRQRNQQPQNLQQQARMHFQPIMGQIGHVTQMNQASHLAQNGSQNLGPSHDLEINERELSRQFDMIEKELAQEDLSRENVEESVSLSDADKERFAHAARQVHDSMLAENNQQSQETTLKFQQSDFLKLMTQILEREVELSAEGNKLVTKKTGEDLREHMSDPLRHEHAYLQEPHDYMPENARDPSLPRTTDESEHIRSHLPDPLAHIKDGALDGDLSSLQAARIISGGQVQGDMWMEDEMWDAIGSPAHRSALLSQHEQEVYDDYRHDDH